MSRWKNGFHEIIDEIRMEFGKDEFTFQMLVARINGYNISIHRKLADRSILINRGNGVWTLGV